MAHDQADNSPTKTKDALRTELRQRRRALPESEQQAAARAAATLVEQLPGWRSARNIALYFAADGELDTAPIAALARQENKSLFLPVITDDKCLRFHRWDVGAPLTVNRYGIPEPADGPPAALQDLDYIFLPLVGWDEQGGRLGMGGGFYDRSLGSMTGPRLVGLAHDCQQVASIPMEEWDVRLQFVVTASTLHECTAGA